MNFTEIVHKDREEWLKWRHSGIGSSDVPVIMGISRFKTYEELLNEKAELEPRKDETNTYIKERGNRIETRVRELYGNELGLRFEPINCVSSENPSRLCSLDGIDIGRNIFVEIKLLSSQDRDKVNNETPGMKKWIAAEVLKLIPEDYYPQIQHQLSVTGLSACVFLGVKELRGQEITWDDIVTVTVLPDVEYTKRMNEEILKFWDLVIIRRAFNDHEKYCTMCPG